MILRGSFQKSSGRPFLEGTLFIPRLHVGFRMPFLVDTGADKTTLSPHDGLRIGVNYDALLGYALPTRGIGGFSETYVEKAVIIFDESDDTGCMYHIDLDILKPQAHLAGIPSLLGRDILNHWHIRYSHPTNTLSFQVEDADQMITLPDLTR